MSKFCISCNKQESEVKFPYESARCFDCRELHYRNRMPRLPTGETVKEYRINLKLTQLEMSEKIGVNRRKFASMEDGVSLSNEEFITKISELKEYFEELSIRKEELKSIKKCPMCGLSNKEVFFTKNAKRCQKCEKIYHTEWYEKNKETIYVKIKDWQKKNPEKVKRYTKNSYHKFRDQRLKIGKEWRDNNKNKMATLKMNWRKENPEKDAEYNHKRRVRGGRSFKSWELKFLLNLFPSCLNCDSKTDLEIDHVVPLALGGNNSLINLQVLCASCNRSKGATTKDYRSEKEVLEITSFLASQK